MTSNNVIKFPKRIYTQEERAEYQRELLIDMTLDLSLNVFNKLELFPEALDVDVLDDDEIYTFTEQNKKDMILIHEAIKSCLYRMHNKPHYLQTISDEYCPDLDELHFDMADDYYDE